MAMTFRIAATLCLLLGGTFLLSGTALAQDKVSFSTKTHAYKTVGDVKLLADVHRPDDAVVRPAVVYIHGGALIMGNRLAVPRQLIDLCKKEGFALVSIDYRLAPEAKLPDIIADVEDAFRWLRDQGPKLLAIDPDRMVVTGGSAGGYLTLMTGIKVQPRPRALVAYWGYGDVDGDWYVKPSEHYRKQKLVDKEDAFKQVGQLKVVTGSEKELKERGQFYLYLRQNGLWTKEVTGFNPDTEPTKLDPYCPVRNVTSRFPPTMLVHGTEDTDVPYELSAAMAKALARHKVPHELVTVKGAGHGLAGGDKKLVEEAHDKAVAFIRSHLTSQPQPTEKPEPKKVSRDFFPYKTGAKWYYNVDVNFGQKHLHIIQHLAKIESIDGVKLARMESTLPNGVVTANEHLGVTDRGLFRHRFNGMEIEPPLCLFKLPPRIGETWEMDAKSGGKQMKVKAVVGRERVRVPAGKFTCFTCKIDTEIPPSEVRVTTIFWFAPGVGIVKQAADVGGVLMVYELEKFEPGK